MRRGAQGVEVPIGPIRVLTTGMGASHAETAIQAALDAETPPWVITCGYAGALDPELRLSEFVWEAESDFPRFAWLEASGGRRGRFHCHPRVVVTATEKGELKKSTGADAVEMESGVIRRLCGERGIPSATFRVISDTATTDMPLDFNRITTRDLRLDPFRLARELFLHPGRIPRLIRFQGEIREAANRLADALIKLPV